MAAAELKDALKSSADTIARYVKDVASLQVTTQITEVGGDGTRHLAAETVLRLDGDSTSVLPGRRTEDRLIVDAALYELHMQSVTAAITYRAKMLEAMLGLLRG